jgi:hypothetical protein
MVDRKTGRPILSHTKTGQLKVGEGPADLDVLKGTADMIGGSIPGQGIPDEVIAGAKKYDYPITKQSHSAINKAVDGYKKKIKNEDESLKAANDILTVLNNEGKLTLGALKTKLPRLFGEVGNLNQSEQEIWSGSPYIADRFTRAWKTNFNPDESLSERDVAEFRKVLSALAGSKEKVRNDIRAAEVATTAKNTGAPEEYINERFGTSGVENPMDENPMDEKVVVKDKNGKSFRLPRSQLKQAIDQGYTEVK